jgi:dipeptidyl aminopeptidase/acylaminoacyl peptidase
MLRSPILCALLAASLTGRCTTPTPNDTLTIDRAVTRYNISTPLLSPDGSKAVVSISPAVALPDSQISHLWLLDTKTKEFRQFTSSAKSENNPRWSPDGRKLAFVSARNGSAQIFLLPMDGGEALPLTQSKTGIRTYEWAPDGKSIVYIAQDDLADSLKKRRDQKFDETVVGESTRATVIYRIDLDTRKLHQLTKQQWNIHEMKWLPSGKELLLLYATLPEEELEVPRLVRFNLADSSFTNLVSPQHGSFHNFVLSPDGKIAAFSSARGVGPVAHDLFIHRLDTSAYSPITDKTLDRIVQAYKFKDNHTLLGLVQTGFENRLYTIKDNGEAAPYTITQNIQSFDVAPDGTLVYVQGGFTQLPELYLVQPGGQPEKVSSIHRSFDSIPLITPKIFTYKSFDGKTIEAALYLPTHTPANGKIPLIAYIHGGPTGAFNNSYSPWAQLLVQAGYAVFCPNIRGSTGYGFDFVAANRKDWGGNDYKDMMAGIDWLIKNEQIDPDRLGISGWSYGGYMAEWAITQTHRFKASVTGAGMANLASEFGTEGGAAYDHWFWGVPYENLDLFLKHSPIAFLKNVTTPTLIIQGEEDETDPKGQSQELYRGLHYYHVPAELVLYPREPHGFKEPNHYIDFYRRMLLWFKKYV